jgi:hypothetical protein
VLSGYKLVESQNFSLARLAREITIQFDTIKQATDRPDSVAPARIGSRMWNSQALSWFAFARIDAGARGAFVIADTSLESNMRCSERTCVTRDGIIEHMSSGPSARVSTSVFRGTHSVLLFAFAGRNGGWQDLCRFHDDYRPVVHVL